MLSSVLFLVMLLLCSSRVAAFVGVSSKSVSFGSKSPRQTQHHMLPLDSLASSSNMLISTIDSDIANIPTNEFAPIFMGGIIVMFGGVLSALIVGFILENGNLYANVVADSYAQTEEDEEFWKGLSDEEKKKAQAMIDKLNAKKTQQEGGDSTPQVTPVQMTDVVTQKDDAKETVELDMFSDYADSPGKK